ncbi:MAG: hypothetical protein ACO230_06680 [Ilumatobacteraceae bacterium]
MMFAYHLAAVLGPRWWSVTKNGMSPESTVAAISRFAAGVTILSGDMPIGIATLGQTGAAGTGVFDVKCVLEPDVVDLVSQVVPELLWSAFAMSDVRALYHSRFEGDPELRGTTLPLWVDEIHFPEYLLIEGRYEGMTQSVLHRDVLERSLMPDGIGGT